MKIFICGGFSGTECMSSVETYKPGDNNWTQVFMFNPFFLINQELINYKSPFRGELEMYRSVLENPQLFSRARGSNLKISAGAGAKS
jgi:hypothetical protein